MSFYDVNYDLVVDRISPPYKRKNIFLAYLNALLSPLQSLHIGLFTTYRNDVLKRLQYNSQRLKLEQTLNEVFNNGNPFLINISQSQQRLFGFKFSENSVIKYGYKATEVIAPSLILYGSKHNEVAFVDFTVNIPSNISSFNPNFELSNLTALVNALKFVGKRYNTIIYTI